jgi:Holliday junction resolvase RusA-like endonuclease
VAVSGPERLPRLAAGEAVRVWCPGRARTKGSLKPIMQRRGPGKTSVTLIESGQYSKPWKEAMIRAIMAQSDCSRFEGPVRVRLQFAFERLAGDEDARFPIKHEYGDIDKLERNALDALTQSGLIKDDSLVVETWPWKFFVMPGELAGVTIWVTPL